ncbi:hypothetical protein PE36_03421 [Moritella sp. PE36]|uniref:hypothetical protein n=1 Tax=Moritella sp. PE36 TaxID=58051 RepID=UPI0001568807|nr:hypothetical protein [Moritella sp. PE36]EDM68442.1 hypothetical protein PE36_03421 [Moritella sp. PE36]
MKKETAVQLKDDAGQDTASIKSVGNDVVRQIKRSPIPTPIPIQYADEVRFQKPEQPTYAILPSIFSILSLLFMATLSSIMFIQLFNPAVTGLAWVGDLFTFLKPPQAGANMAAWTWVPFLFTIIGSVLGMLFELGLLLSGHAFQQTRTKFGVFILNLRLLNLAPVVTTIFFFITCMVVTHADMRFTMLYLAGGACFGLGFALFFGGAQALVPLVLAGIQVAQIIMVLTGTIPAGGEIIAWLLVGQAALQLTALLIGTATPWKSTAFHTISTISGVLLYSAILNVTAADISFSQSVAVVLPEGSLALWGFVGACITGLVLTVVLLPKTLGGFLVMLSNTIWSPLYFFLVSADRFPHPFNLTEVYGGKKPPAKTTLKPYYQVHPEFLLQRLSIPAVVNIEESVTLFKKLIKTARTAFSVMAILDHYLPQANVKIPLTNKKRMAIWSDGSEYWPGLFTKKIFGLHLPDGGKMDTAPEPVIAAFKEGQLLGYLAESGVASPFLKPAPEMGEGILTIDFSFLENYETKSDYESYGGAAYFKVNSTKQRLELISVVAPHTTDVLPVDPRSPSFRRAESLVLASMYYQVISGKHLAEIHMTYNLVEVAMHDAFEAQGQWAHPFRTFMYLHFFAHELAEEITTEHLVQEGAVFSQVFATTHDSLVHHLNDCYSNFEYGADEDFEARAAMLTMQGSAGKPGELLPNACIKWELDYAKIWNGYTTALIDIIYTDDAAVQADKYLQDFHAGLLQVMVKGLPARYEGFQTKAGIARFASDTIHHTVVRHQVYGTTGIRAALDPRISKVQVPVDGGTPAINEWRSLAFVALATGKARFTLLQGDFTNLLNGVDAKYKDDMHKVFDQLQEDLAKLETEWTATEEDKQRNYNYFRAIPSVLHTGPGY